MRPANRFARPCNGVLSACLIKGNVPHALRAVRLWSAIGMFNQGQRPARAPGCASHGATSCGLCKHPMSVYPTYLIPRVQNSTLAPYPPPLYTMRLPRTRRKNTPSKRAWGLTNNGNLRKPHHCSVLQHATTSVTCCALHITSRFSCHPRRHQLAKIELSPVKMGTSLWLPSSCAGGARLWSGFHGAYLVFSG